MSKSSSKTAKPLSNNASAGENFVISAAEAISDYRMAYRSRQASLMGRKEVLTGKAKFGIFGDGKEVPQLAMARFFKPGDFRAGYYRDQTFMFASGLSTIEQFFAQLYADTDLDREPASGGRGMNCHFGTRLVDEDGSFVSQTSQGKSSSDISPTGGQMARLLGLAFASKLYRAEAALHKPEHHAFSKNGNEIAFGTIGDASTSEGIFWETLNAAGVLQVPLVMNVWDDGYGISVPREFQTVKGNISQALEGFQRQNTSEKAFEIHRVKGWDYAACLQVYAKATAVARHEHCPQLVHVQELTQPQGHSTSGSHERYKSSERLKWEEEFDCLLHMRNWLIQQEMATNKELEGWENEDRLTVENAKNTAWKNYLNPIKEEHVNALKEFGTLLSALEAHGAQLPMGSALLVTLQQRTQELALIQKELAAVITVNRKAIASAFSRTALLLRSFVSLQLPQVQNFIALDSQCLIENRDRYNSHLYSESKFSPLQVAPVSAQYDENSELADGRVVLLRCFDAIFQRDPRVFAFGEDVGKLGDVNLVFEGLSTKYGDTRISDTGIREATILGQGIGIAMRGLRPIVDIQYLDYLLYALQVMSDDLATLRYRTRGGQKAPVIVRTKGHRLEGVWHTGSPIGMIINSLRGMHVCVPRNCTQAAGMYNTLLEGDDPALVIEVLNGYRLKERIPNNIADFKVALGIPEIIRAGTSVTLVTYGACVRIAQEAAVTLDKIGVSVEIIDVQTLLPFDINSSIRKSIEKTNAVLFLDEDVPGGASAYLYQQVIEGQKAFDLLELPPRTLSAVPNRSPYASDGDYFSKPNSEDVVRTIYAMMHERNVHLFP